MKFVAGLTCHLCGKQYPAEALWVCSECLGPLEITYDYDRVRSAISRELIESRPRSLWRYRELLPVEEPKTGFNSGYTPLVRATRLARQNVQPPATHPSAVRCPGRARSRRRSRRPRDGGSPRSREATLR